eukprot:8003823-Pyramimonas_sp.AAC.1
MRLQEIKRRTACKTCHETGHWPGGPECKSEPRTAMVAHAGDTGERHPEQGGVDEDGFWCALFLLFSLFSRHASQGVCVCEGGNCGGQCSLQRKRVEYHVCESCRGMTEAAEALGFMAEGGALGFMAVRLTASFFMASVSDGEGGPDCVEWGRKVKKPSGDL